MINKPQVIHEWMFVSEIRNHNPPSTLVFLNVFICVAWTLEIEWDVAALGQLFSAVCECLGSYRSLFGAALSLKDTFTLGNRVVTTLAISFKMLLLVATWIQYPLGHWSRPKHMQTSWSAYLFQVSTLVKLLDQHDRLLVALLALIFSLYRLP